MDVEQLITSATEATGLNDFGPHGWRDGLGGKWHAAYFMKTVAEKHPVPQAIKPILKELASTAGKPPFRSSYQYEISRAGKAAQQTLEQIDTLYER